MPWYLGVILTVAVPLVVIYTYLIRKVARAFTETFRVRRGRTVAGLSLGVLALNALPIVAMVTYWVAGREGTQIFSGESRLADIFLVYPFWTTLVVGVQSALLLLLWDIVRLVATRLFRRPVDIWNKRNGWVTLAVVAVVIVYTVPVVVDQTLSPSITRQTIPLPERFAALDGLKILHLSDVQGDGRTSERKIEKFVRMANDLEPDMVMNCGDIVTTGQKYIASTAKALSVMHAPAGRFAAVGDHDIFSGVKAKVLEAMRASGHIMLEDTSIIVPWNQANIGITFVTYTYPQRPSFEKLDSLLGLPDSVYRILLVHQPAMPLVDLASRKAYDLFLAGHTHGGGVAFGIPGLGLLAPASFETRYVSGLYRVGAMAVNVTNGLGFTLAPIRFNAPIELSLLTLRVPRKE